MGLDLICGPTDTRTRKTKVVCTLGPKCWSKEGLEMLVDTGINVARCARVWQAVACTRQSHIPYSTLPRSRWVQRQLVR